MGEVEVDALAGADFTVKSGELCQRSNPNLEIFGIAGAGLNGV
jgi:hypothetical protein